MDQTSPAFYISAGAELKLVRALEHRGALSTAIAVHEDKNAFGSRIEEDPETGEYVAIFMIRDQPPPEVGLILSDCIHNLRQALDHDAYTMAALISGEDPPPNEKTASFPIHTSAKGFRDRIAEQVADPEKMPDGLLDVLKEMQPFKKTEVGRKLAILQDLDNRAKHRRVPVTVGIIEHEGMSIEGDVVVKSTEPARPLKKGEQVIGRFEASSREETEIFISGKFRVAIVFDEDSPAGPVEVGPYVEETRNLIRWKVLAPTKPFFRKIPNPGSNTEIAVLDDQAEASSSGA